MNSRALPFLSLFFSLLFIVDASAAVSIETSVSRSRVSVGEQLILDITVTDADGQISKPVISSIEGFSSYSQGHSQEISIINGKKTSRSIFSYVLIANSAGSKTIGPFEINIGGRSYKVAPVQVQVDRDSGTAPPQGGVPYSQTQVTAPPARALPSDRVSNEDIFVKAWLDKDEVVVNQPIILTYTLYTRLNATYKGFDKEPETTGFWVEDFPPEKTIRRTEQILAGSRYVVADVRKIAFFPTQNGIFTIDPGTLSAAVELRSEESFDTFVSYNIFGRRGSSFPSTFISQIVSKLLPTDKVSVTVKALPEAGRPPSFSGAVGRYSIESSVDKDSVKAGDTLTYRVRIFGEGNINTAQMPELPAMEDFKKYDSSTSTHISKERLKVEGEKIVDTVIVPRKAGAYTLPSLKFSYFDPQAGVYKEIRTTAHHLSVMPGPVEEEEPPSASSSVQPVEKEDVSLMGKDIRYIKKQDDERVARELLYKTPIYWIVNALIVLFSIVLAVTDSKKTQSSRDFKSFRLKRSHQVARKKLRAAAATLKEGKSELFYAEIYKAVQGYFADKLDLHPQSVSADVVEERLNGQLPPETANTMRALFNELSLGRFGKKEASVEEMKKLYALADEVISSFEKVKQK